MADLPLPSRSRRISAALSPAWDQLPAWWIAALLVAMLALTGAAELAGGRVASERAIPLAAALIGLVIAWQSILPVAGRVRTVRAWIAFGFLAWTASEVLRTLELIQGEVGHPTPSDLLLVPLLVAAGGAYWASMHGRSTLRDELTVYLDAAIVAAAVAGLLLAAFGDAASSDPTLLALLIHGVVFLAILGATGILHLAVAAELNLRGAYAVLIGLAFMGVGFVARAGAAPGIPGWLVAGVIAAGVLVVAVGTATWSDRLDSNPTYLRIAGRLRELLPMAAAVPMPILLVFHSTRLPLVTGLVHGAAGLVLVGVVVRQSVLFAERGAVLGRLQSALTGTERRTQLITGVEAVGRVLARQGPTPAALREVVGLLVGYFGYSHVLIYLADGDRLYLADRRGYSDMDREPEVRRGIAARVMRTRRAAFIPEVGRDPDYVVRDPAVRSAICVPMLAGEELVGVLEVESTGRLEETDLKAAAAVADQAAAAIGLGIERQRLVDERDFTTAVLDTVGALVIVVDRHGRIARFNPACAEVSGYSLAELRGHDSFDFLIAPEERGAVEGVVGDVLHGAASRDFENDWVRKDGSRRRISWSNTAVFGADGAVRYTIATGVDVTERRRLERQLAHRALHDPLTGLANRALLMDRVEHILVRRDAGMALLFLDVDDFKQINDTLGHATGDRVLCEISARLRSVLRPSDTAARLGGDEFAVVLEEMDDPGQARAIAQRIAEQLRRPFAVDGSELNVRVSIGVATSQDDPRNAEAFLRSADLAMYSAKSRGGGRIEMYEAKMYATIVQRRELENLLRRATEADELTLYYQPVVELATGRPIGSEALLRWQHPGRGLLLPADFLALAEETGAIVTIGRWVLNTACREASGWSTETDGAARWVSVNLSARQLQNTQLVSDVEHALAASGLAPERLVLEITESLLVNDMPETIDRLRELKALGVQLGVDDFGTGYSSLNYLRRFPVNILKLDRSFVADLTTDMKQRAFVGAIVTLGRTLQLTTIAEGVETAAQSEALQLLGCEIGQGYLFGRPAPAERQRALAC